MNNIDSLVIETLKESVNGNGQLILDEEKTKILLAMIYTNQQQIRISTALISQLNQTIKKLEEGR